jgi:putative DNA primase/helicase
MLGDLAARLEDEGIICKTTRGTHRTACPQCDRGPKDDTLAVTIDEGGAVWLCHRCGYKGGLSGEERTKPTTRTTRTAAKAAPKPQPQEEGSLSAWGRKLWAECKPITPGTPAGAYLEHRGCFIPDGDHLRWHPNLENKADGYTGPALLGLVTDLETGAPINLHRTWLKPDGSGKAEIDHPRLGLKDHSTAGVIRLQPNVKTWLVLGEGVETCLHAAQNGYGPAWSVLNAGNLQAFPVLPWLTRLRVLVDHDKVNPATGRRPGTDAARTVLRRYADTGDFDLQHDLTVIYPPNEGEDAADLDHDQLQVANMTAIDFLRQSVDANKRLVRIRAAQRAAPTTGNWLVKGVIRRQAVGVAFGPSGAGKSTVVVDLACHVADRPVWRGRKLCNGPVLWIASEDHVGANDLLCAWELEHNNGERVPVDLVRGVTNLRQDLDLVIEEAKEGPCVLVVIDTLSATWHDETNEGMATYLELCRKIAEETGSAVLVIHHPGHANGERERGGSALRAGCDFSIQIKRGGETGEIKVEKVRGAPDGAAWGFKLDTVTFGKDEDGEDVTACVSIAAPAPLKGHLLTPQRKIVLKALFVALDTHTTGTGNARSTKSTISEDQWRDTARLLPDEDKNKRQTYRRVRDWLVANCYACYYDGRVALGEAAHLHEHMMRATDADYSANIE